MNWDKRITDDGTILHMWVIYNATINDYVERGFGLRDGNRRLNEWRVSCPNEYFMILVETPL